MHHLLVRIRSWNYTNGTKYDTNAITIIDAAAGAPATTNAVTNRVFLDDRGRWRNIRGCVEDGLETTRLVTGRLAMPAIQRTQDTKEVVFEEMVRCLMERSLLMTALVDGYDGHGEEYSKRQLLLVK